ncbi:MAG TPA: DUF2442 domain-containing protein [Acidimicrobiales bacterium]|nr:DUF2442 domain-containing protein [Acidimicrobiales bacterium]
MKKLIKIPKVVNAEVTAPYRLHLTFDDGLARDVDMSDWLWGDMFEPLKDPEFFARVTVDHGTVVWPNGVDLDPVVLHGDFEPASSPRYTEAGNPAHDSR